VNSEIIARKCSGSGVRFLDMRLFLISIEMSGATSRPFTFPAYFMNSVESSPNEMKNVLEPQS